MYCSLCLFEWIALGQRLSPGIPPTCPLCQHSFTLDDLERIDEPDNGINPDPGVIPCQDSAEPIESTTLDGVIGTNVDELIAELTTARAIIRDLRLVIGRMNQNTKVCPHGPSDCIPYVLF